MRILRPILMPLALGGFSVRAQAAIAHTPEAKPPSKFRSEEAGWFDFSEALEEKYGFIAQD